LQREVGCGPTCLIERWRFGDPVDGPELEQLRARLEVARPAGG
jgi:hypothetical protein